MEMLTIPKWYIAYTRPLQEKKVIARFFKKNIEHYCPMKNVKTPFSNRQKPMRVPLLTSCVFVHATPAELSRIKKISEVISLVHWLDKPVVVENSEMDMLRKFLNLHSDITIEKIPVSKNSMATVIHSPFLKEKEVAQEVMNSYIKLQWPSLGYELRASLTHQEFKTSISAMQEDKYQQSSLTKLAI